MRIEKLKLINWCQFAALELPLGPGLIGVRGRNGSGKSNAVEAMVYGLTGKVRTEGNLRDNVRQGKSDRAKSGVEMVVNHNDATLDITRYLTGGQSLVVRSPTGVEESFDKAAAINSRLVEILGIDEDMLLRHVFVAQWQIAAFLDMTNEKRSQFFARLFDVEYAEAIYRELGDTHIDVPIPYIDADACRARLNDLEAEARALRARLACLPADEWRRDLDPDQEVIEAWRTRARLDREVASLRADLAPVDNQLVNTEADEIAYRLDVDGVTKLVASEAPLLRAISADLSRHEAARVVAGSRQVLEQNQHQLGAQLKTLREPVRPDDYLAIASEEIATTTAISVRLGTLTRFLHTFAHNGSLAECPTCHEPTANLAHRVEEFRHEKVALAQQLDTLSRRNDHSRQYDVDRREYLCRRSAIEDGLGMVEQQFAALPRAELPSRSEEELRRLRDEYEQNVQGLEELHRLHATASTRLAQVRGRASTLRELLTQKLQQRQSLTATDDEAAQAEARLLERGRTYAERDELRVRLSVIDRSAASDRKALLEAEGVLRSASRARSTQAHLQSVRDVFHRERLARRVVQANLECMQRGVNDVLDRFDSPFRIQVLDGLRFQALFGDGRQVPAARLSGGEKAVFAMAFRLAVNSRYVRDLGLLVLDEPTAGLDDGNLACLEVALTRLRELSRSRGLQVILITHERLLDSLFDCVVELPSQR